jgi:hypothetical protein
VKLSIVYHTEICCSAQDDNEIHSNGNPAFLDELLDLPGHERQRHTLVADEACTGGCVGR